MNKKSLLSALLTTILIGGLILVNAMRFGTVHAATEVTGIISSDNTWTKANSPYSLIGPVGVHEGVTLTIEEGATVNLSTYYLQVNGTLQVIGSSANPVHINSAQTNAGQIKFTASSTNWNELG